MTVTVTSEAFQRGGCDGDFGPRDRPDGRYGDLLQAVRRGTRDGDRLTLTGPGVRLVFRRLGDVD